MRLGKKRLGSKESIQRYYNANSVTIAFGMNGPKTFLLPSRCIMRRHSDIGKYCFEMVIMKR